MPMPKDDVNRIIKATIPINHLSSNFIMTSLVKIYMIARLAKKHS